MVSSKNKSKIAKNVLCLLFAFLFSVNSFAAVVSDNDGSAFITKAEFDSLKNDFQSRLDSYNTGIDSMIDAAIASYLAGIQMARKTNLRSTLEACGQTYDGRSRKSYVFAGNDSNRFMARYNNEGNKYFLTNFYWNYTPRLYIQFRIDNEYIGFKSSAYAYKESAVKIGGNIYYEMVNNDGSIYPSWVPHVFLVDENMRVTGFKL